METKDGTPQNFQPNLDICKHTPQMTYKWCVLTLVKYQPFSI